MCMMPYSLTPELYAQFLCALFDAWYRDWRTITYVSTVSYTHLRAHETRHDLVCRLLLEKKKRHIYTSQSTRD